MEIVRGEKGPKSEKKGRQEKFLDDRARAGRRRSAEQGPSPSFSLNFETGRRTISTTSIPGREEERETEGEVVGIAREDPSEDQQERERERERSRERGDKTWHRESEKQRERERGSARDFERGGGKEVEDRWADGDGDIVGRGERVRAALSRENRAAGREGRGWWVQNVRGCRECSTNTRKKYPSTQVHTSFSGSRRESGTGKDRSERAGWGGGWRKKGGGEERGKQRKTKEDEKGWDIGAWPGWLERDENG